MVKIGDKVKITNRLCGHEFNLGDIVEILNIHPNVYFAKNRCGNSWYITNKEFETLIKSNKKTNKMNITKTEMKEAVESVANQLANSIGRITTLELKMELRNQYPAIMWYQYQHGQVMGVSNLFHELVREGKFKSVADNGTYQTYMPSSTINVARNNTTTNNLVTTIKKANPVKKAASKKTTTVAPTVKGIKIARSKALDLMKNNKGHFFTVTFIKQDSTTRTLNGQYVKDQTLSPLGYVLVKEASKLKTGEKNPIRNVNLQTLQSLKIKGQVYTF